MPRGIKMKNALARLKAAVDMSPRRRTIDLPNGEVFEFYTTPLTLAEREKAQKDARKPDEVALTLMIQKCRDENGRAMFALGQVAELKNELPAELLEQLQVKVFVEADSEAAGVEDATDLKSPAEGTRRGRRADAANGGSGEAGEDAL
jgi:hypothetical protein